MAPPSVVNVFPRRAPTSGDMMVRILGENFRVQPDPLLADPPSTASTVRVLFGDVPAPYVAVVNHALLYARAPAAALRPDGTSAGPVAVRVQNLDDAGAVIPGETGTLEDAFTYETLRLTARGFLARAITALIRKMRAELIPNVALAHAHTDYDATAGDNLNIVEYQQLPAITLVGPELELVRDTNELSVVEALGARIRARTPYLANMRFTLIGSADRHLTLLNLQAATIAFFERNQTLQVDNLSFDMDADTGGSVSVTSPSDENDITTFTARIRVMKLPVSTMPGFEDLPIGAIDVTDLLDADEPFRGFIFYQLRPKGV
jgi:IPT/TIG domain